MTTPALGPLDLVVVFRLGGADLDLFDDYERRALALLCDHGGVLDRRVRDREATIEVHLLRFPDRAHFEAFKTDSRRQAFAGLFARSGVKSEVHEVTHHE